MIRHVTAMSRFPTLCIGVALFLLAVVTFEDARSMEIRATYGIGADAASYLVAAFLALLAVGHLFAAVLSPSHDPGPADWVGVTFIGVGLAGLIGTITFGGGFIFGATLLFAFTARAFGRRTMLVDLAIGFVLGLVIFLLFNKFLTLALPMGPLERLF